MEHDPDPTDSSSSTVCDLYGTYCDRVPEGCLLMGMMKGQAEMGGTSTSSATPGAGPKMTREAWDDYVRRTIDAAEGCRKLGELILMGQELTDQKNTRGDFS